MTINFQAEDGLHIEAIVHGKAVSSLSPGAAVQIYDELGRAIDKARELRKIEEEENRERYSLELGVIHEGERKCALEAGPFETSADAVAFAMTVKGQTAGMTMHEDETVEWYDLTHADAADLPIIGATLNVFTHRGGTTNNIDLY